MGLRERRSRQNPCSVVLAHADSDPVRAREVLQRGLAIAQGSGNRYDGSNLANVLGRLEALYGEPVAALDYLNSAIANYRDAGNTTVIRLPLGVLAALLARLGLSEAAAIIAGYAFGGPTKGWIPELGRAVKRLREVLGGETYESLARKGASMTPATMATYAYDQIDQARTGPNTATNAASHASKSESAPGQNSLTTRASRLARSPAVAAMLSSLP